MSFWSFGLLSCGTVGLHYKELDFSQHEGRAGGFAEVEFVASRLAQLRVQDELVAEQLKNVVTADRQKCEDDRSSSSSILQGRAGAVREEQTVQVRGKGLHEPAWHYCY
eukprot:g43301.t1